MGRWARTVTATDLNNDGWEDIVIGTGHITGDGPDRSG